MDLIDRDLLLWNLGAFGDRSTVESLPTYTGLAVARSGRDVFVEDEQLYAAIVFGTVFSLRTALAGLVPMMLAALDVDPATTVTR